MGFAKLWKTRPKIPAGKAQRDFPAPRGHAPGRRDQGVGASFPCPTAVADAKGRRALWAVGQERLGATLRWDFVPGGEPPARVPHREKSHWDFSRPSCAVFSGTQGRETLSRALQAFCKKLDQKLLVSLYRTLSGQPALKIPAGEAQRDFPGPSGHGPQRGHAPGTRPRYGLGREGPGTAPGSAGTAAAKTAGCTRTWGRSGAQTRTPAGNS